MDVIGMELVSKVFSLLDITTLFICLAVCKTWNSLIMTPEFQKLWQSMPQRLHESSWILLNSCERWTASTGISRFPVSTGLWDTETEIVASACGLVCVSPLNTYNFVVGNPLTGEWVPLPEFPWRRLSFIHMKMEVVDPDSGAYRLGALVYGSDPVLKYVCVVYDSTSNRWTKFSFSEDKKYELVVYDLQQNCWMTLNSIDLRNVCPGGLPRLSLVGVSVWKHDGNLYLGSPWYSLGECGLGVWKVDKQGNLAKVVTVSEVGGIGDLRFSSAEGNLMCIAGRNRASDVFDMSSGSWHAIPSRNHGSAVVYRPSLIHLMKKDALSYSHYS